MKVFIDTSAFVALLVKNETDHKKVAKRYLEYRQERAIFFTSDYILDELFTRLLYYKVDIKKHIQTLRKAILEGEITVLRVDETLFEKSIDILLKFSDQKISFTDATSLNLYKDLSLDEIFTLDGDFKKMRINTSF